MLTEQEAINLAEKPHLVADAETCNTIISYLSAYINDLDGREFDLEVAYNNEKAKIMMQDKIIPLKEAECKTSQAYRDWQEARRLLRKFRGYRNILRKKEEMLWEKQKYGNYNRVIN